VTEPHSTDLPRFSTQLLDAYLYEANVSRRERKPEDDSQPTLNANINAPEPNPDSTSFSQLIGVTVVVPFRDGSAILEIRCTYNGVFGSSSGPMSADQIKVIAERTTTVLLWPYLRAGVAEIGRMTAVPIPQIPTLDVANFLAESGKAKASAAVASRTTTAVSKRRSRTTPTAKKEPLPGPSN
jgi:preprotein translocase subunit SecB